MDLQRFSRTEAVLGREAVDKLNSSFVVVAGLGGVGGYCLEALARTGIMHFRVVDFDVFDVTNLNRQILCLDSNIGNSKTDEAEKRLLSINPDIVVEKRRVFIDEKSIDSVLEGNPDLVVDAIDSVDSKCLLLSECIKRNIDVVSSMGAAFRKNVTMIRTADISDTFGCPLAKCVRSKMKEFGIEKGIDCVFSPEKPEGIKSGKGSLATVVGAFGFALAQIALEKIYNKH